MGLPQHLVEDRGPVVGLPLRLAVCPHTTRNRIRNIFIVLLTTMHITAGNHHTPSQAWGSPRTRSGRWGQQWGNPRGWPIAQRPAIAREYHQSPLESAATADERSSAQAPEGNGRRPPHRGPLAVAAGAGVQPIDGRLFSSGCLGHGRCFWHSCIGDLQSPVGWGFYDCIPNSVLIGFGHFPMKKGYCHYQCW